MNPAGKTHTLAEGGGKAIATEKKYAGCDTADRRVELGAVASVKPM